MNRAAGRVVALVLVFAGCGSADRAADAGSPGPASGSGFLEGAGDARIHYQVLGAAPDTIVVVHGGPGAGMNAVLPELEPLAERHTMIFYDQRGGGLSELPADTTRLDARWHVEDLEAVRRFFDLDRMTLIAHSFGAILAATYARERPERVERMVFFGATGPSRAEAAELARSAVTPPDPELRERLQSVLERLLAGSSTDPIADCREYESIGREMALRRGESGRWKGTNCAMPPEAVRYYFRHTAQKSPRSFGDWDFTGVLDGVEAPLLVIHGARDPEAIEPQRAWAAAVPNGRLLAVPGAGKAVSADRPDVFFPAVEAFLQGRWPEDAADPPDRAGPSVEYLANEGVLVTTGEGVALIDGLFGEGLPGFPVVEPAVRDSLENARGRFAEIDAILVTHVHRDHFDASAVARHLGANPDTRLIAPAQAIDTLRAKVGGAEALLDRVHALRLEPGRSARFEIGDFAVQAFGLVHPPSRNEPVEMVGYRIEMNGREVAHLGDASPDSDELEPFHGVDLLLAPWWIVTGVEGARRLAAVGARFVGTFHLGRETVAREVEERLREGVDVVVLHRSGMRMEIDGGRGP